MSEKKGEKKKKEDYKFAESVEKMIVRAKPAGVRPSIPQPEKKKDNKKEG